MKQKSLNPPRIILRTDQRKKDGRCSIILRVIIHGLKKDISLKVYCHEDLFDRKRLRVKSGCHDSDSINLIIDSAYKRANDIIFNARVHHLPLNLNDFIAQYEVKYQDQVSNDDFIAFVREEIELEKKKNSKAVGTVNKYGFQLNKLIRYRNKIMFTDITENFLADFEVHMREVLKNKKSSSNNTLKFIRKFINVAIKKGVTSEYAFKNYQILESKSVEIKYLTLEEFNFFKEYFQKLNSNHKHFRPLKSFLFSCYTGLRYGDNKRFTLQQINDNCLSVKTEKTNKLVSIPLLPEAIKLLNFDLDKNLPNLNTPCDQTCNRALKEIARICNVQKPITTHYARHTFACLALNFGINKESLQSFLGHSSSKQTDHYAKLFDTTKSKEMKKLVGKF